MTTWRRVRIVAVTSALLGSAIAVAQMAPKMAEPGTVIVGLYRIAPGKHLDFLKWMAAREAVNKEVGAPAGQWYVHENGDSWDFINIAPELNDEQDAKVEQLTKKKGLKSGLAGSLELRQYIASHTDTFARGPQTAADLVKAAGAN